MWEWHSYFWGERKNERPSFFTLFFSEVFFFSVNLIVSLSLRSCAVVYIFLGAKILSIYLDSWCKISLKFLKSSTYIILVRKKSLKNLLKKRSDKRVHSFHERAMKECHSLFSKGAMWECHSFFWQGAGAERHSKKMEALNTANNTIYFSACHLICLQNSLKKGDR